MIKWWAVFAVAILAATGLTLVIAIVCTESLVYGIVMEMIILAGYLAVCALVADKIEERRERDEEDVEIQF